MESIGESAFEVETSRQLLLGETLARNARKCPDLEGVIFKDGRIRYRELDERVNRLANALLSIGIMMGDSVGLIMENRQEMVEVFFAAAKIGAVNVRVNTRLAPREMAYIVKNVVSVIPMVVMEFDPLELLKAIEAERVTFLFLVPTMWLIVMDHPDFKKYDVSSLRTAAYGADRIQNATKKRIMEAFPNAALYEAFGQTEMSATAVLMKHQDALRKEGSVGLPFFNVEVRVVDDQMNDVCIGDVGEIVYRGPGMFKGYYKNPQETEKAFEGGWFHSGDLVRQDAEGFVYVVDRKKDMIISGGENIYSAEIEALLITHPKNQGSRGRWCGRSDMGRGGQGLCGP